MNRQVLRRLCLALFLGSGALCVRAGTITGRLLDPQGNPVSGARIQWTAYRVEEESLADQTAGIEPKVLGEAKSGVDGKFRAETSPSAGQFSLRVQSAGLPEALLSGPFDPSDSMDLPDLQLPAVAGVKGRVVDENNKPVPQATVRVGSGGGLVESDVVFFAETKSGADGGFTLATAPEGFRFLEVRAAGYVPASRALLGGSGDSLVTLRAGGTVRVTVLDASGNPASGAIVVCEQTAGRADATGLIRLTGVPAGARAVEAIWKNQFVACQSGVKVRTGAETGASLRLSRAASIEGTVIDGTTRKPVGGARIAILEPGLRLNAAPARRAVRSDSRGRFQAGGLESGRYTVEAARSGYVPSAIQNVAAAATAAGSVSIALEPAASISGRVLDEKKQPVRGVSVRVARDPSLRGLLRRGGGAAILPADRGAVTGPDGQFQLQGLSVGHGLSLEATKAGFAPARSTGIALKAGERLQNVDFILKAGLGARGRVVDAKGQAVAGAEIRALRRTGRGGGRFLVVGGRQGPADAVSAADGAFSVSGLEEGDYEVLVSRQGFGPKTASLSVKGPGQSTWAPIVLSEGAAVSGFVRDSQGAPIGGATVFLIGESAGPQTASTGGDGVFRLGDLVPGKAVMIAVNAEGYAPARSSATPPANSVAIVLTNTGTIRGRVQDSSGSPISEFTVTLSAGARGGFGNLLLRAPGGGVPGPQNVRSADGSFEIGNVPPGTWTVRASAAGYRTADVGGVSVGSAETKEDVVVSLKRGGALVGKTIDASSGVPVANATVSWEPAGSPPGPAAMAARLLDGGGANVTSTDADGRFSFDGLPEGKITLTATHPDYLEATRDFDADAGMEVQMPLGSGGSITGAVVGSDGTTPVPQAQVRLDDEGDTGGFGPASQTVSADGGGGYRFDHLGAGRFRLTARSDRGTSAPKEVILAENQRQDGILLQVGAGTLLDGAVSGLPAGQLGQVRVTAAAGTGYRDTAVTDDSGKFTLRDVPSGVVTLTASTAFMQGRTTSKTVEIPEATAEMPVEIVFEGLSRLSGRVTRGSSPLSGLFLLALPDPPDGSGRFTGQTDEAGRYALEGMSDGNYQVSVNGPGVSYRKSFTVSGDTNGDINLPTTTLTGTVVDAGSGEAIDGATVQAETGQETQAQAVKRAQTDSAGAYEIADLDPGNYQVTARKAGYQLKTQSATVGGDGAPLDFSLLKGSGASIRVTDGLTGIPLGGVNALAFGPDGSIAFQGMVALDSTGTGEIPSLAPGRYAVYVFSGGYAPRSIGAMDVPVPAAVPIAMTPGGSVEARSSAGLTGRILDGSGAPYLLNGFRLDGVVTVMPPVTVWQHLAPGSYTLFVVSSDGSRSLPFSVAEGQTTQLVVK